MTRPVRRRWLGALAGAVVVLLAGCNSSTVPASGTPLGSGAPGASGSAGDGALAALCPRFADVVAGPGASGNDATPAQWNALSTLLRDAAGVARTTPLQPEEGEAGNELATEFDDIAAMFATFASNDSSAIAGGSAEEPQAVPVAEAFDRLAAAADFAAQTSLGSPLDCIAPAAAPAAIDVGLNGLAIEASDQVPAGWNVLRVQNHGTGNVGVALIRLDDGAAVQDLETAIVANAGGVPAQGLVAVTDALAPAASTEVRTFLVAGRYALVPIAADGALEVGTGAARALTVR